MKTTQNFFRITLLLAIALLVLSIPSAFAASGTWNGTVDATWAGANWSATPVPGTGDTATFNNAGNANTTLDLGSGVTIGNLYFNTASAAAYTIGSGAAGSQTLTLSTAGGSIAMDGTVANNQTINAALALATTGTYTASNSSANILTMAGPISTTSTGIKVLKVDGVGNTAISGLISSGTGTMNLEKTNSGTLTFSGGATFNGNGVNCYLPGSTLVPVDLRQGTTKLSGGTYSVIGEFVVGGVIANGGAGNNVNFTMNGGSLSVSTWFSLGRGNGIGGVSSDLVFTNAAAVTAGNLSGGFHGGSGLNLPKGSMTMKDSSTFTITGNGAVNFAESAGSDMTMTLNDTAQFIAAGTAQKFLGEYGKGTVNLNDNSSMLLGNGVVNVGYRSGTGTVNVASSALLSVANDFRVGGSDTSGTGNNGYGTVNMTGGSVNVSSLTIARGNNYQNGVSGEVNLNGGTLTSTNNVVIGYAGAGHAKLALNGGALNVGTTAAQQLMIPEYDTSTGELDITNGAVKLNAGGSIRMSQGNNTTGINVINLEGGSITYYSDFAATLGGSGNLDMQYGSTGFVGTNIVNLDGGALTVPQITSTKTTGTRTFNFNGGTLKPTASSTTFMNLGTGSAVANVRNGGAVIDSNGKDITIAQALVHSAIVGDAATDGGLVKNNTGTLTLTGANTYTGNTTISGGTLKIGTGGSITSQNINVAGSAVFDVLTAGGTLAAGQSILGSGSVSGSVTASSTSKIIPGTDGTVGTLTFNNNLTINAGSTIKFDLSATSGGSNDKLVLSGAGAVLTPNGAQITINSAGTLDTSTDYVLFDLTGGGGATTSGTAFNTVPIFVGTTPPNPLNYSIVTTATQVLLHYNSSVPLSGVGAASPSSVTHGQSTVLTVTVTPGTSPDSTGIAVVADLTAIGGSASQIFYDDGTHGDVTAGDNVFSYSTAATSGTSFGSKTLNATVTDAQSRSASPTISLTVVATSMTWDGAGADDNFGTAANWGGIAPGVGDLLFFAGSVRPTPNMEANYTVDSVTFNSGASSFTVGTSSSTLTLTGRGVTNNSVNPQTLNVPITMHAAQTVNAASGDITVGGAISGGFGLTKVGSGTLTLSAANSYTGGTTVSAGTLVLSGDNTSATGGTTVSGTLQLQNANAVAGSALTLNGGSTLSLQADADATFNNVSLTMNTGGNNNFLVNSLTGAGNGHTLAITNNAGLGNGNTTINITSTTSDTLAFGNSFGVSANGSSAWGGPVTTFSLDGANVILNGMNANDGGMSVSSTTGNSLTINGTVSTGNARTIGATINSGVLTLNNTVNLGGTSANYGFFVNQNAGTLNVNNGGAIRNNAAIGGTGNRAGLAIAGGTLDNTSGSAVTLQYNPTIGISGDFIFQGSTNLNLGTGAVTLQNSSRQITVSSNKLTIGGAIGDSSFGYGLTKAGNGTLTLSGANTYTGNTALNAGTLQLGNHNVLPSGTTLNRTGGTVDMNGKTNTVNAFQVGGTVKAKGTWGSTASGATHQNNTYFTSTSAGVLTVTTGGATTTTLAAGGTSTYGDSVAFTATVTGNGGDGTTPSGTVTFYDDGTPIGTGSLSGSGLTATATLNLTALAAGTHNNITAAYAGSDSYDVSTASAITQVVTPRAVQLTGSRNYDGSATASYSILSIANVVGGDTVSLSSGSATLASANGGLQSITANTLNLAGASAANYTTIGATGTVRINPAPASPYVLQTTKNTPATNETSKLVAMAGDAGVTLSVSLSGTDLGSPAHGSISLNGGDKIIYTPATDYVGADTFTYTLSDDAGGSSTGTVSVTVNEANVSMTLTIQVVGDTAIVTGSGIPNQGYDVQISPDLSNWSDYASTNAAANGVVIFTDPDPVSNHGTRSYRLKQQ